MGLTYRRCSLCGNKTPIFSFLKENDTIEGRMAYSYHCATCGTKLHLGFEKSYVFVVWAYNTAKKIFEEESEV